MAERHKRGQKLFKFAAGIAPSMGMIGTLIGLVQMLQALDDPSSIGPAMAVALLTTLYGAIIAFMICTPIAEKLESRTKEETLNMKIVMEGVEGILKGENPRLIIDKLEGFLAPKARTPPDPNAT
ncbi:MAG: MotA/TolQ/ExbB proton channel family protein, partial [Myxococcota bacterium]